MRATFEAMLRTEARAWAEPLEVVRLGDYRAGRADQLTAWLPLGMDGQPVLCVLEGRLLLALLDQFFGGSATRPRRCRANSPPPPMRWPSGSAPGWARRSRPRGSLTRPRRLLGRPLRISNPALVGGIDAEDVVIVTRFGIGRGDAKPVVDILIPCRR
ncbi:hypothetical protein AB5I41_22110 [Sphingomonas sp. MMS24-JH45]